MYKFCPRNMLGNFFHKLILVWCNMYIAVDVTGLEFFSPVSACTVPGLPDGFFSDQKSPFGYILDLVMENVFIYCGNLLCFTTIG
jgi:hypothetical protein